MPESVVSGVVGRLCDPDHAPLPRSRTEEVIEIVEAVMLALMAVATA